jgi:hypothetical protein
MTGIGLIHFHLNSFHGFRAAPDSTNSTEGIWLIWALDQWGKTPLFATLKQKSARLFVG